VSTNVRGTRAPHMRSSAHKCNPSHWLPSHSPERPSLEFITLFLLRARNYVQPNISCYFSTLRSSSQENIHTVSLLSFFSPLLFVPPPQPPPPSEGCSAIDAGTVQPCNFPAASAEKFVKTFPWAHSVHLFTRLGNNTINTIGGNGSHK
jgi:hypothetical protein